MIKLSKSIELPTGVIAAFWHVPEILLLPDEAKAHVTLKGYISEEAFLANKASVSQQVLIVDSDNPTLLATNENAVFTKIQASDLFSESVRID